MERQEKKNIENKLKEILETCAKVSSEANSIGHGIHMGNLGLDQVARRTNEIDLLAKKLKASVDNLKGIITVIENKDDDFNKSFGIRLRKRFF